MAFISMDLLGPYSKMESGMKYVLTIICMLTNYVFMISIKTKTTEDIINAYLKHVYAILAVVHISLVLCAENFPANNFPG